jgi:PrtD family type I secretion system ABC transporter
MIKYALLFGCVINILMLATPIYSMQVLDRVISSGNTDTLLMLTLVIVGAIALLGLIQLGRTFATTQMGNWFEKRLSEKIFTNAVKASLMTKGGGGSQQIRDLQTVKTFLTSPALLSMLDIPWALIFVIVLFIIHTYMGILTVAGGIFLVFMALISEKITKPLHDISSEYFISSTRQVDQAARNAEVIEVMGFLPNIIKNWQITNEKVQNNQNLVNNRQAVLTEITKFVRMLLQILTTGIGAYLVLQHEMSTGAMIACSSLSGRALAPFEQAITSYKGFLNFRKAYERLEQSLERFSIGENRTTLPVPKGKIGVENIFFAPPGVQRHVIKGVTFDIQPGEVLVIIGPSASGKTTLAKLIVGALVPQVGAIRIDNANIQDWNRNELGQHMGYLPQDIELFSGTIKENIARMDKDADSNKVVLAAQLSGVHDMILQLPKGYDTEIGADGSVLSGGQRQRIGLARAFYNDPKILVLDEPNSNLDSFGEIALAGALARAKENGITTIVISHRTSLLTAADKILAMRDGMVAIFGDRDEVLEKMNQAAKTVPFEQMRKQNG